MRKSYARRQFLIFVFLLIFTIIGISSLYIGLNTKRKVYLKYQENNDIDYKVYLKENDFFDEEYLPKGRTYITSLIDHIEVLYKYNIDFTDNIDGTYKYKIIAKIEANKADTTTSGNYWTKEYDITEEKTIEEEL